MVVKRWRASGQQLADTLDEHELGELAAAAASVYTQTLLRITGTSPPPALLDARSGARILGPWCTAKWLYNHAKDLPPSCVRRIGRRVLFVGPKLKEWACDSGQTITRERKT